MIKVVKTLDDAWAFKRWVSARSGGFIALDTETTGVNYYDPAFKVRIIQFGSETEAWVIEVDQWLALIKEVCAVYEGRWLIHNSRFDIGALATHGVVVPWHNVDDTMIAMRLAEPTKPAGLKQAATRHVSRSASGSQADLHKAMKMNKWDWDTVPIDFPPYVFYAAMDVILTSRLYVSQICQTGLASPVYDLEMEVRHACSVMENNGMRVNRDFCIATGAKLRDEADQIQRDMQAEFGFSVMSPSELSRWMLSNGGKLTKTTSGGKPSVDKEALDVLIEDPSTPPTVRRVASAAIRSRQTLKLASSYFDNFINLADGDSVLHPSIETVAARTGRMSIRDPALQTLPRVSDDPDSKLVRNAVIPRTEDELIVSSDYEQIELRIVAALSEDRGLVDAFKIADETGLDFFTQSARQVYNDESIQKSDGRRPTIKSLFYAACPHPDTRVLCDDLVWRPAGDLVAGQGLWGFDEHLNEEYSHARARSRKWRHSVVTGAEHAEMDCVKVTLASGKELICARDHYWLTQQWNAGTKSWTAAEDLIVGRHGITKYSQTWETLRTYEAGWIAGILEGEGCISKNDMSWRITQLPGGVADRIEACLSAMSVPYARNVHPTSGCYSWYPTNWRLTRSLELLGAVQATRLIEKIDLDGRSLQRLPLDQAGCDTVVSVEPVGSQPVVILSTSTATYLAEGYGSHNSYGAGVSKMALTAGVPIEEMQQVKDKVFSRYPGMGRFMKASEQMCRENDGWVKTQMGRKLWVDPNMAYKASNARIQGTAADVLKLAVVNMAKAGLDEFMVVPVHDELVLSVPRDQMEEVRDACRDSMADHSMAVPLLAEPSEGYETWGSVPK